MTGTPRRDLSSGIYFAALGLAAVLNIALPRHRVIVLPLFFGVLHFGVGYAFARLVKRASRDAKGRPLPGTARKKRSDEGRWLDAPIAEIDKSTTGILLANRWRRDPSLRIIARQGGLTDAAPGPHGGLWDREIDG